MVVTVRCLVYRCMLCWLVTRLDVSTLHRHLLQKGCVLSLGATPAWMLLFTTAKDSRVLCTETACVLMPCCSVAACMAVSVATGAL